MKDVRGGQFLLRSVGLVLRKLRKKYECGIFKLEMMIEGERKKRVELNERVNV